MGHIIKMYRRDIGYMDMKWMKLAPIKSWALILKVLGLPVLRPDN
jgi:hypothetical protein